jgi:hypothetical protein
LLEPVDHSIAVGGRGQARLDELVAEVGSAGDLDDPASAIPVVVVANVVG